MEFPKQSESLNPMVTERVTIKQPKYVNFFPRNFVEDLSQMD